MVSEDISKQAKDKIRDFAHQAILRTMLYVERVENNPETILIHGKEMVKFSEKWEPEVTKVLFRVYQDCKQNPYFSIRNFI